MTRPPKPSCANAPPDGTERHAAACARGRASRRPARAGGESEHGAPRCCVGGAAHTPPTWKRPRPGRPGPTGAPAVLRRSSPRPARAPIELLVERPQDVQIHRQLADLALRFDQPPILLRARPALQALPAGSQELLTPRADRPGRHPCPWAARGGISQRCGIAGESRRSPRASERTRTADPFITSRLSEVEFGSVTPVCASSHATKSG
jgi:hypothetical protein